MRTRNAANPQTLKEQEAERKLELSDIRKALEFVEVRRFVWRIMTQCRTFESVWEPSAKIHYNSGQQDVGHFIMAEIAQADQNLLFKLMAENKSDN